MKRATRTLIRDYGVTIGVAVLAALSVRTFIVEAYRIPTPSMRPILEPGDTLFVAKWAYGLRWPHSTQPFTQGHIPRRGEIVVYNYHAAPGDRVDSIKRVVGLPGDRVALKQGVAWLNGKPLGTLASNEVCGTEERLPAGAAYRICREPPLLADRPEETVPDDHVYVLPDYRSLAANPRKAGPHLVPTFALRGRPLWIWMSIEPRAGLFPQIRFERLFKRVE